MRRKENETVLEGWKSESTVKGARKMTRKQLAKVNTKMTTFLIRTSASPEALEEIHEIEPVVFDTHALERERVVAKQEKVWRNARMITALLKDLVHEFPGMGVAMDTVNKVVESVWDKLRDREMARVVVTRIMDEIIDMAWWKCRVEDVWNTIRYEKEIQKVKH